MNILYVTDVFPFPVRHATSVFAYNWIRSLVERHTVSLIYLDASVQKSNLERIEEIGVQCFTPGIQTAETGRSVSQLFRHEPTAFTSVKTKQLYRYLADFITHVSADVVVLGAPFMGVLLSCEKLPCPVIYVPSDSISLNLASRFRFLKNPFRLAYAWLENRKWARAEQVIFPKADACVVVSEQEASAIAKRWTTIESQRMHVIPVGVDIAYFQPSIGKEKENHLVITGNMSPVRLVVALKWFMLSVLPIIRENVPGVTLDIVGKDPHPSIVQIAKTVGGIRVTGDVPDTRTYFAEASVCIYPMLLGSGVKTNLLEAMAMSKAVVATSMCLPGLQAPINGQLAIADDKEEFAWAVIRLLQDPKGRKVMGNAAREFIKEYHCWDSIVNDKVENLLSSLT